MNCRRISCFLLKKNNDDNNNQGGRVEKSQHAGVTWTSQEPARKYRSFWIPSLQDMVTEEDSAINIMK